jgi:hypothetical protein
MQPRKILWYAIFSAFWFPLVGQARTEFRLTLAPATTNGVPSGFDVAAGGRLVAPVRLSSNGLLTATRLEDRRQTEGDYPGDALSEWLGRRYEMISRKDFTAKCLRNRTWVCHF